MSESAKLRLVRCPKCENLLPELPDYSVYRCGGCGTVLQAKIKNQEQDASSDKSDEERAVAEGLSIKSTSTLENGSETVDLNGAPDLDFKPNGSPLPLKVNDSDKNKEKNVEQCENEANATNDKCSVSTELNLDVVKDDLNNSMGTGREESNTRLSSTTASVGSKQELEGVEKNPRDHMEAVRFSTSNHENNRLDFISSVGELLRNRSNATGVDTVKHLEQDRLELLRKLDELKDQLTQSSKLVDGQNQIASTDAQAKPPKTYSRRGAWSMDVSSGSNAATQRLLRPENFVAGPSYSNCCPEPFPLTNGLEAPMNGYYSSLHNQNSASHFGGHFGSHLLRSTSYQLPYSHQQQSHQYHSGHCVGPGSDPVNHYPHNPPFHHASCSCFHCQSRFSQANAPAQPPAPGAYYNRSYLDVPNNPSLNYRDNAPAFGARVNNMRTKNPSVNFRDRQAQSRWKSDFHSELGGIGGIVGSRPRRTVLVSNSRRCYPIAGGAPFLTCYSCHEMLQIPKKLLMAKNQRSVRCGACSTVINFAVIDNKLVISNHSQIDRFPTEVDDSDDQAVRDNLPNINGHVNRTSANFSSDDYDNTCYDFESLDREPALQPIGSGLSSTKQQEMPSCHPSSSCTSEDETSPDVLVPPREAANNLHRLIKNTRSPPLPGSPLQTYFDYSSSNHRFSKGNKSSRSDQENVKPNKVTSRQNSLKEATLATEMDVPMNEYPDIGAFQESQDISREDDQPKANKRVESFLANIIKKSVRFNQADVRNKNNVSVNGNVIPYRMIKKAEKLAGPIHPGLYWYDARAGFWGIMGGHCLGIIPPFIKEFDYPMPENCAGGNTGVFVNGRELHQKDLDLLARRGLPNSRGRSYIIEISGRVLDEDSGEELEGLGKLAPTVEKVKHGFGMKVPRTAC